MQISLTFFVNVAPSATALVMFVITAAFHLSFCPVGKQCLMLCCNFPSLFFANLLSYSCGSERHSFGYVRCFLVGSIGA